MGAHGNGYQGHRDLWVQVLWSLEWVGDHLQIWRVSSHLHVEGNDGADELPRLSRKQRPNDLLPLQLGQTGQGYLEPGKGRQENRLMPSGIARQQ